MSSLIEITMSGGVRQRVVTSETEVTEESVKQNVADTKPRHPDKR